MYTNTHIYKNEIWLYIRLAALFFNLTDGGFFSMPLNTLLQYNFWWFQTISLWRRKNFFSTLLGSISGAGGGVRGWEFNWKKTVREKRRFFIHVMCMGIHRKLWLKEVIRIWGLYTIIIGKKRGKRVLLGKTNDFWGR